MMESESSTRAASLGSAVAGIACATGWYLFIGAALEAGNRVNVAAGLTSGAYWAPGIIGTVGLAMLNAVNWESVTDDGGLSGFFAVRQTRHTASMESESCYVFCAVV
mmetsp:Transcript_3397/g.7058  ORF Transcript_3397/g.7058 Transcript_3397/m.7058 type:complete len:107 (-) Transcript_3397:1182-1502(-)